MLSGNFASKTNYTENIRPGWIKDVLDRNRVLAGGIKLNASTFVSSDAVRVALSALANPTATTLTVAALLSAIPNDGQILFQDRAAITVTVSTNTAADAVSLPVNALSARLASGTVLYFGGSKKFAILTAAAAAGATALTVQALPTALVAGDVATVAAVGNRVAQLSQDESAGATTLHVDAITFPLDSGEVGYYTPPYTTKRVVSGTPVKITKATFEAAAASGAEWSYCGPGVTINESTETLRLLCYDVPNVDDNNDGDILRPNTLIAVNFLPNWANLDATVQAAIRNTYEITVSTPGQEVAAS